MGNLLIYVFPPNNMNKLLARLSINCHERKATMEALLHYNNVARKQGFYPTFIH